MEIKVVRSEFTPRSTVGKLYIDGALAPMCWTLELPSREQKPMCIPPGRYEVIINWSNRFKRLMPLLLGVPGFEGVRIHMGNDEHDTEGCILLGEDHTAPDWIGHSIRAFSLFFLALQSALRIGKVFITLTRDENKPLAASSADVPASTAASSATARA